MSHDRHFARRRCTWVAANKSNSSPKPRAAARFSFAVFRYVRRKTSIRFVAAFGLPNFAYEDSLSNAVRINKTPRVFTANEAPPDVTILFSSRNGANTDLSQQLFFFCEQPSVTGGATPLCRSDVLWERLVERCPRFANDCEPKGYATPT